MPHADSVVIVMFTSTCILGCYWSCVSVIVSVDCYRSARGTEMCHATLIRYAIRYAARLCLLSVFLSCGASFFQLLSTSLVFNDLMRTISCDVCSRH